jgi:hypothetical protein
MKAVWLAFVFLWPAVSASHAASVTVADSSTTLQGVAAATTAALIDARLRVRNAGGGNFTVEARGLHCDSYSNAPLDAADPHAGLPTLKCRVHARNKKDTRSGRRFGDGRAINDLLQKVQDAGGIQLIDCASGGYCGTFAKSIKCTINTTIDNFNNGGRWSCVFTDGQ